jgi:hypothetical protein
MSRQKLFLAVFGALLIAFAIFAIKSKTRSEEEAGDFLPISGDLKPGWQLYAAKDRKPVGLVKEIAPSHAFQDGTTQEAVLVLFTDATENWIPRKQVKELYVAQP